MKLIVDSEKEAIEIRKVIARAMNEIEKTTIPIVTIQHIVQRLADIRNNIVVADSKLGGER
ncbi:hypothetical protein OBO34_07215 [Clostridiales Family XIII bacterium ASD5510]|uniref:Uncharacterized protein n=1 Tax=Hominibacterium faecale TaxID=2839743 RepID=A0A9J6QVJ2_9FIRM|nr:hypothetical protein [Hominibacterium faecale]MCU7378142.1 hypothetical protein [Hominibacterium faecale]